MTEIPAASRAFAAHAPEYTALRRRLVPDFDGFYGAAVSATALAGAPLERVLDLGAGTGLLSAALLAVHPSARVELLDAAEPMLAEARGRLGSSVARVHVVDMAAGLPAGPFDAVVSALAIHHLTDADKVRLFERVHAALRPGGVFVNAEQVAGPTAALTAVYTERWVADCRALGASPEEIDGGLERMAFDRCTDVESQLGWLRAAGFPVADVVYKHWRNAVLVARRAGETAA